MKSVYLCNLGMRMVHPDDVSKVEATSPKRAAEIYSGKVEKPSIDGDTYNVLVRDENRPFVHRVFAVTLKTVQTRKAKELT
jgi:hypothetical protein